MYSTISQLVAYEPFSFLHTKTSEREKKKGKDILFIDYQSLRWITKQSSLINRLLLIMVRE